MEDREGKLGSGSHAERPVGRSTARNGRSLKGKRWKIVENGVIVKRSRIRSKGGTDLSGNGFDSEATRRKRPSKFSLWKLDTAEVESGYNESRAGSTGSGNSDNLGDSLHDESSERNRDMANDLEGVVASCKNDDAPRLYSCLESGVIIPKRRRGASRRKKSQRLLTPRKAAAGLSDFLSSIETYCHHEKVADDDDTSPNFASGSKKEKVGVGNEPSSSRKRVSAMVTLLVKDEEFEGKIAKEKLRKNIIRAESDSEKEPQMENRPDLEKLQKNRIRAESDSEKEPQTENRADLEKLQKNRIRAESDSEKEPQMESRTDLVNACDDSDQHVDEEENLEHNAARMLSSRFDPRCTDTSSASSHSERHAPEPPSSSCQNSMTSCSAVDATRRLLRPKKRDSTNLVRKRRHFYEVHAADMDSYWVVKKKIKVFCPLDHAWCFGVVKDYNPDTKMHLIKYDSRDEDWVDLQKERIKLLLFPSEICGNSGSQRIDLELEGSVDEQFLQVAGDKFPSSLKDSEPIISYYSRLTQKLKKSLVKISRKKSRFKQNKSSLPTGGNLSRLKQNMIEGIDTETGELPISPSRNLPSDRRFSFMYSRKRSCKVKREPENITNEYCGSTSLLAPERGYEPNITSDLMRLELGNLKLGIDPIFFCFLPEEHPFCRELLFSCKYAVVLLWPVVYMEIVFVDKALGWRFISFEGCLNRLVVLLSLILTILRPSTDCTDYLKLRMPCTLVSCKLSGLQGIGGCGAIFMSINLDPECLKWALLEHRLNNFHALMVRQVNFTDGSTESVGRFLGDADLVPYIFQIVPLEDPRDQFLVGESIFGKSIQASCALSSSMFNLSPSQHPKVLPTNKDSFGNLQNCNITSSHASQGNNRKATDGSSSIADDSSEQVSEITLENPGSSQSQTADVPSCSLTKVEADALSLSSDDGWKRASQDFAKSGPDTDANLMRNTVRNVSSKKFLRSQRQPRRLGSWRAAWGSHSEFLDDITSSDKYDDETHNYSEMVHARKRCKEDTDTSKSDLPWKIVQDNALQSPETKGFCIMQHPISPDFSCFSENCSADFSHDGYINRYRKPRTRVQYSLPRPEYGHCSRSKTKKKKSHLSKKIKSDSTKCTRADSKSSCGYPKSFTCEANVLVTDGDRGWREFSAQVALDYEDHCWKLLVKLSGNTRYSYKADQFIQPGTTNRHNHAMVWKGGSNWALEFMDRNQWIFFKEMHEECYNRNIRAASVKNIPIPGVRPIKDDNFIVSSTYCRSSHYIHQDGNEVDLAMDPSHVVYDMDSDDEEFISRVRNLASDDGNNTLEISDKLFEKAIDKLEKLSYSKKCDEFSETEIERFLAEIGSPSVIRSIYEHWHAKRQKKGVPLVRQFQPALWEQYQKKVKEWEVAVSQTAKSSNCQQEKHLIEKPRMFAFCLKPRRLKVLNKSSSHRPHRKFLHQTGKKEQDKTRPFGRKPNKLSLDNSHQNSRLPWRVPSSPISANTTTEAERSVRSERIQHLTLHGSNPKKMGIFQSQRDTKRMEMVSDQRQSNGGPYRWNSGLPECSGTRQAQVDRVHASAAELEEFKLRDASNAAQHSSTMAKLKKEKAQWLLRKADFAIHKATAALIVAEAIQASEEDLIGDG